MCVCVSLSLSLPLSLSLSLALSLSSLYKAYIRVHVNLSPSLWGKAPPRPETWELGTQLWEAAAVSLLIRVLSLDVIRVFEVGRQGRGGVVQVLRVVGRTLFSAAFNIPCTLNFISKL